MGDRASCSHHSVQARTTIKSQIIADFFADWGEHQYLPPAPDSMYWRMNFDGSKMLGGLGASIIFTSPKGDKLLYVLQIHFCASNNVAEYEALVHGLKLAKEIGIRRILCFRDSDLVVHQVSGEWDAKDANMASYRFYISSSVDSSRAASFITSPEQTMTRRTGYPRSALPGRRFQLECRWRKSASHLSSHRQNPAPFSCRRISPRSRHHCQARGLPPRR
jgi:hypothetical protein